MDGQADIDSENYHDNISESTTVGRGLSLTTLYRFAERSYSYNDFPK